MDTFLPPFRVSLLTKKTNLLAVLHGLKKRPLSTIRLLFRSAENPIEVFPRVRVFRVDPMLLRCHTLLHVSFQPMTCRIDLL